MDCLFLFKGGLKFKSIGIINSSINNISFCSVRTSSARRKSAYFMTKQRIRRGKQQSLVFGIWAEWRSSTTQSACARRAPSEIIPQIDSILCSKWICGRKNRFQSKTTGKLLQKRRARTPKLVVWSFSFVLQGVSKKIESEWISRIFTKISHVRH